MPRILLIPVNATTAVYVQVRIRNYLSRMLGGLRFRLTWRPRPFQDHEVNRGGEWPVHGLADRLGGFGDIGTAGQPQDGHVWHGRR